MASPDVLGSGGRAADPAPDKTPALPTGRNIELVLLAFAAAIVTAALVLVEANQENELTRSLIYVGAAYLGLFTVAQFSFWGNYLPRVFPTHLRGTGEGFAANVGGRMLGTGFAFVTTSLVSSFDGPPHVQLAKAAAIVAAFVYVCGVALSFFLPEPKGEELPE